MALKANKKRKRARWQGRRKAAAVSEAAKESREGQEPEGPVKVLSQNSDTQKDLALIGVAIEDKWPTLPENREIIVERLMGVIKKETVDVITKDGGIFPCSEAADRNALTAIDKYIKIEAANDRKRDRVNNPQTATTINVGVNVENRIEERRNRTLAIAERFRPGAILVEHPDRSS